MDHGLLHDLADAVARWRDGLPHRQQASSLDRAIGPRPFTNSSGAFDWTGAAGDVGELQQHQLGPLASIPPTHPQRERIDRIVERLRELARVADEQHPMDGGEAVGDLIAEAGSIVATIRAMADEPTTSTTTPDDHHDRRLALRPKEAAKMLGIGERKLWELTNTSQIPHTKAGRAVIYSIDDLRQWLGNSKGTS